MSDANAPVTDAGTSPRPSRALEITAAAALLAFCGTYLGLALQLSLRREAVAGQMDARTWPTVLGVLGVLFAVALLVVAITRSPSSRDDLERIAPGGWVRAGLTLVLSAAFVGVWGVSDVVAFGYRIQLFPIAVAVFMAALLLVYGHRRWLGLIAYPVGVAAFVYVLFGMLLRIPL